MQIIAEVINSTYNDDTGRIELLTALRNVEEVNPPEDILPGTPVGVRWIRQVEESFTGRDLEVQSALIEEVSPASTYIGVADVTRLPNRGSITINRDGSTEEIVTYTSRNPGTNRLLGISTPTLIHQVGEIVRPSVEVNFLGTFEIDLGYYPIRHNHVNVLLNGVTELRENVDFEIVNEFTGNICTRGFLRFTQAGRPSRFKSSDLVEIEYQYFEQTIGSVEIHMSPGNTDMVSVYDNALYELRFDELSSPDRDMEDRGNIRITPPLGSGISAPTPVIVTIPDIESPRGVTLAQDITTADNGQNVLLSSVEHLPKNDELLDATDDLENRKVTINGNDIYYSDVDPLTNELINVSGIATTHSSGSEVLFDSARYVRDVVKDAINRTTLRAQLDAVSVSGNYLRIVTKIAGRAFNLQAGTYNISFIGFSDETQRGLHESVTTIVPFENKDLTFRRYASLVERQEITKNLIGQVVARRVSTSPGIPYLPRQ